MASSTVTRYQNTVVLDSDKFWVGECIGEIPHGKGTIKEGKPGPTLRRKKDIYIGTMKDGKFDGKGTYTAPDDTLRYSGDFKDGKYHGEGILHFVDDSGLAFSYEGEFSHGKKSGKGVLKFLVSYKEGTDQKIIYDGYWVDDLYKGYGTLYVYDIDSNRIGRIEGEWDRNEVKGKIMEARTMNVFAEGHLLIPNLLGDAIDYELIEGTEFNNVFDIDHYYESNELITDHLSIPYKKMIKSNSEGMTKYVFDIILMIDNKVQHNAILHLTFEHGLNGLFALSRKKLEIPEINNGYIFDYYNTSDGHNGTFTIKKNNQIEFGRFNSEKYFYDGVVRLDAPLSLDEFHQTSLNEYNGNYTIYNMEFSHSNDFVKGIIFHNFDFNPIQDKRCFLNRTQVFSDPIRVERVFKNGRIYQRKYPCNANVTYLLYDESRYLSMFELNGETWFTDSKYPENRIILNDNNVTFKSNGKVMFKKTRDGMIHVIDADLKKTVYPKLKHTDMEIYVDPSFIFFLSQYDSRFWMKHLDYFGQDKIKMTPTVNFRRVTKAGEKTMMIDFSGYRIMSPIKHDPAHFKGILSVNKSYIKGSFDDDLKTHGYCEQYDVADGELILRKGLYCHGTFVRPHYVGYINEDNKYHGPGTLYVDGHKVKYTGIFNNDVLSEGKKYENDMLTYAGELKDFLYHGIGTEYFADGKFNKGIFKFGTWVVKEHRP